MKAKIKIVIIILIIVVASGIYSIVDKTGTIYNEKCDNSDFVPLELSVNRELSQKFVCDKESLDGFEIKISANIVEGEKLALVYKVWDDEQGESVLNGKTDISGIENGKFFKIKFSKIKGCKDKILHLKLTLEGENEQQGVVVYYTPGNEKGTELKCETENFDGTLVLRTIAHGFDIETFIVTLCFLAYIVFFMRWLYKLFA